MKKILVLIQLILCFAQTTYANQYIFNPADPSKDFVYEIEPGQSFDFSIGIANVGDEPGNFNLYAVDAIATSNGTVGYTTLNKPQFGIGKWIQFTDNIIQVNGQSEKVVELNFEIPEFTPPGAYVGGLMIQQVFPEQEAKQTGAKVTLRIVKKIIINIPGEKILDYEISSFSYNQETNKFSIEINNKGNTILKFNGNISITNDFNSSDDSTIEIKNRTILPKEKVKVEIPNQKELFFGQYNANISLELLEFNPINGKDTNLKTINSSLQFTIIPFPLVINTLIGLLALLLTIVAYIVMKKLLRPKLVTYKIKDQDNINNIAKEYKINWKKLAKYNNIKPPYILNTGTIIKVPKNKK